jgi:hypothetical protein
MREIMHGRALTVLAVGVAGLIVASGATASSTRFRLSITPRVVQANRLVTYRLTLGTPQRCLRHASVRLRSHRTRTDRHGRATLTLRIRKPGIYRAIAFKRGCGMARAAVRVVASETHPPASASHPSSPDDAPASSFDGSCQLSGGVRFQPLLTTSPHDGSVSARAEGTCSGTLTDAHGNTRSVASETATAVAHSAGLESCAFGKATGDGELDLARTRIRFTYDETRTGPALVLSAKGARGGSAIIEGNVSPSANPVSVLEACGSGGLAAAPIDVRLATTPAIAG